MFSSIGGRKFVNFNVDVALGDITVQPVEIKKTEGWLQDYGFPLIEYYLINSEQQFAEKLHAYTLPYVERVNTRVKDLVDMLLILQSNQVDYPLIMEAIRKVFKRRNTHATPLELSLPPEEWERKYKELANECNITLSIIEAHKRLNQFYKEIINGVYKS